MKKKKIIYYDKLFIIITNNNQNVKNMEKVANQPSKRSDCNILFKINEYM